MSYKRKTIAEWAKLIHGIDTNKMKDNTCISNARMAGDMVTELTYRREFEFLNFNL